MYHLGMLLYYTDALLGKPLALSPKFGWHYLAIFAIFDENTDRSKLGHMGLQYIFLSN